MLMGWDREKGIIIKCNESFLKSLVGIFQYVIKLNNNDGNKFFFGFGYWDD